MNIKTQLYKPIQYTHSATYLLTRNAADEHVNLISIKIKRGQSVVVCVRWLLLQGSYNSVQRTRLYPAGRTSRDRVYRNDHWAAWKQLAKDRERRITIF